MPGVHALSREFGVHHTTAAEALGQLEREGYLKGAGAGKKRQILIPGSADGVRLRVGILFYEPEDVGTQFISELRHRLDQAGQTGGGNNGPFHFIQFDLSAESIALGAGVHSFSLLGVTDNGEGGFLIATNFAGDDYAGGSQIAGTSGGTGSLDTTRDSFFAVTAIPEPSTGLLALLGSSALLLRRRRA